MGLQQTLKALADPIRREILNMLKKRRMSAGEITEHFSVTAPSISRHLSEIQERENSFSTKLTPLFWRKQCFGLQL